MECIESRKSSKIQQFKLEIKTNFSCGLKKGVHAVFSMCEITLKPKRVIFENAQWIVWLKLGRKKQLITILAGQGRFFYSEVLVFGRKLAFFCPPHHVLFHFCHPLSSSFCLQAFDFSSPCPRPLLFALFFLLSASITATFYSRSLHVSVGVRASEYLKSELFFPSVFRWHVSLNNITVWIFLPLLPSLSKPTHTQAVPLGAMCLL